MQQRNDPRGAGLSDSGNQFVCDPIGGYLWQTIRKQIPMLARSGQHWNSTCEAYGLSKKRLSVCVKPVSMRRLVSAWSINIWQEGTFFAALNQAVQSRHWDTMLRSLVVLGKG